MTTESEAAPAANPFGYPLALPELATIDAMPIDAARRAMRCGRVTGYPRYLYKYRECQVGDPESLKRAREILVKSNLWLTRWDRFDDPFDVAPSIRIDGSREDVKRHLTLRLLQEQPDLPARERRALIKQTLSDPRPLVAAAQKAIHDQLLATGVCPLTADPTNIQMWHQYANRHEGICIQLEVPGSPRALAAAWPVDYSARYPILNWLDGTHKQAGEFLLRKSLHWAYEKEYRILTAGPPLAPYPFLARACTGVIVGMRASAQLLDFVRICNRARVNRGAPRFRIYRAVPSNQSFRVSIHRVFD